MKAIITQTGMTNNKWAIIELFDKANGKFGIFKVRCPFDNRQDAIDRAESIAKNTYDEQLEIINETTETTELINNY